MFAPRQRRKICACRQDGDYCPDEPVPVEYCLELSDEMKAFLVQSRERRMDRLKRKRNDQIALKNSQRDAEQKIVTDFQERRKKMYGDSLSHIESLEKGLNDVFLWAVQQSDAVLWPAVALSFGKH
uniref:Uncharacterized protein n=1 Tax=Spongospora subterranea TaxID=70186 RepID=A0A0H5R606_9EUKA|eukprot:CRZ09207.1 hypothetical protein [Spongospora subterranea]